MLKLLKNTNLLIVLLLTLLSFYTWRDLPSLQLQGEGFMYFAYWFTGFPTHLPLNYDTLARLLFSFLPNLFYDKIELYMWFLLVIKLLIDINMYFVVNKITGSKLAAFLGTLLFSLSMAGNYDMYASGGYQYFIERAIILLPLLISFSSYISFFQNNFRLRFYISSLLLYLLGISSGFFGTWFMPVFIFYTLSYFLFHLSLSKLIKLKIILAPVPFVIGNYLLIKNSVYYSPEKSIPYLLFHDTAFTLSAIFQQLEVLTLPIGEYIKLKAGLNFIVINVLANRSTPQSMIAQSANIILIIIMILIYSTAFYIIWKLRHEWMFIATAAFLSLISALLFNIYLNAYTVSVSYESSRYYYYPYTMFSLFWGVFLCSIFLQKKLVFKLILPVFCLLWFIHNNLAIQRSLETDHWRNQANKDTIEYLRAWSTDIKSTPSFVYLPATFGPYGVAYAQRFYSHPDGVMGDERNSPLDMQDLARQKINPNTLYVLNYNYKLEKVENNTQRSRLLLKQLEKGVPD